MKLLIFFPFLMILGCSTIHFSANKNKIHSYDYDYSQWHHIGILDLMEFSKPVNLKSICQEEGRWSSVKVETGFVQGLISNIPYVGTFYSPEKVEIACSK